MGIPSMPAFFKIAYQEPWRLVQDCLIELSGITTVTTNV